MKKIAALFLAIFGLDILFWVAASLRDLPSMTEQAAFYGYAPNLLDLVNMGLWYAVGLLVGLMALAVAWALVRATSRNFAFKVRPAFLLWVSGTAVIAGLWMLTVALSTLGNAGQQGGLWLDVLFALVMMGLLFEFASDAFRHYKEHRKEKGVVLGVSVAAARAEKPAPKRKK